MKRILTASVLFVLIASLSYMGGFYFLILMSAMSLAMGRELYRLFAPSGLKVGRNFLMACILLTLAGAYAGVEHFLTALYISTILVFAAPVLRGTEDISGYLKEVGLSLVFIALLAVMTGSAVLLINIETEVTPGGTPVWFLKNQLGFFLIAIAFLCGAANDSAAYFVGKWKGKIKLVPNISPSKTVEGCIAGIVAAVAAGLVINLAFGSPLALPSALLCGSVAGISCIMGDLVESAIKRNCNAKDSGTILPGHGGVFDRFDGMIFVFPTLYIFAIWL